MKPVITLAESNLSDLSLHHHGKIETANQAADNGHACVFIHHHGAIETFANIFNSSVYNPGAEKFPRVAFLHHHGAIETRIIELAAGGLVLLFTPLWYD